MVCFTCVRGGEGGTLDKIMFEKEAIVAELDASMKVNYLDISAFHWVQIIFIVRAITIGIQNETCNHLLLHIIRSIGVKLSG